jgi:FKBP-type peptidyl-prolyl cis-trans isomerase FklB
MFNSQALKLPAFAVSSCLLLLLALSSSLSFVSAGTTAEGFNYLELKKLEDGVVVLESGLMYKELRPGTGKTPTVNSPCSCHYSGTLINGNEFDSSYKRGKPTTFAPNQVIKGWTEAMQLMKEGAKWELYIPSELAYGDRGMPHAGIDGGSVLIFTLELIEVLGDFVPQDL